MFWCDFAAGWVGGCAGIIVGQPFDTMKVGKKVAEMLYEKIVESMKTIDLWGAEIECTKYAISF